MAATLVAISSAVLLLATAPRDEPVAVATAGRELRRHVYTVAGGGIAVAAAGLLVCVAVARTVVRRANQGRDEAIAVAVRQLPDLLMRLHNGKEVDTGELPTPSGRRDEFGAIGDAVARLARQAIDSAVLVHKERDGFNRFAAGVAERALVVIAALLHNLDDLQRRPNLDPELKDTCYTLDHELVQLRRQLENLLLLTGGTVPNPHTRPVKAGNIIIDAVGESPARHRVRQEFGADGWILPEAAGALTHMLAELIDNALNYSAPQLDVVVRSVRTANGIAFEVEDRGNGLSTTLLSEMNGRLKTAPLFADMANTQQLGLFVAGRLSAEPGLPLGARIPVTLRASAYGGLSAVITVPQALLTHDQEPAPAHPAAAVHPKPTVATPAPRAAPAPPSPRLSTPPAQPGAPAVTADGLPRRIPGTSMARQLHTATSTAPASFYATDSRTPEELAAQFDGFPAPSHPESTS
ncbi:ATP-binding protein [Streptomyces sp. NPDC004237]|uniref:sensor histidine kinase n=1 Tax=unclassified Streptomyces TaxID=2593676 RepID=UPI0033A773F8